MGIVDEYRKSLKPLDVEEPIDVWVHRPLAYLLARALKPTRVTANQVTCGSMLLGILAGIVFAIPFAGHMTTAGLLIFASAIFDCADGQLARMRQSSSAFGRMLDGVADTVVTVSITAGGAYCLLLTVVDRPVVFFLYVALIVVTAVTCPFHTSSYDHYKNLFLRLTHPKHRDGEDLETAQARRKAEAEAGQAESWALRVAWPIYLSYVQGSSRSSQWFDPYTVKHLDKLPPYDAVRADIYRRHALPVLRVWRSLFGFGTLVFTFAACALLGHLEWFAYFHALGLNVLYFGLMMPWQRRVSKRAFAEMGLTPP